LIINIKGNVAFKDFDHIAFKAARKRSIYVEKWVLKGNGCFLKMFNILSKYNTVKYFSKNQKVRLHFIDTHKGYPL